MASLPRRQRVARVCTTSNARARCGCSPGLAVVWASVPVRERGAVHPGVEVLLRTPACVHEVHARARRSGARSSNASKPGAMPNLAGPGREPLLELLGALLGDRDGIDAYDAHVTMFYSAGAWTRPPERNGRPRPAPEAARILGRTGLAAGRPCPDLPPPGTRARPRRGRSPPPSPTCRPPSTLGRAARQITTTTRPAAPRRPSARRVGRSPPPSPTCRPCRPAVLPSCRRDSLRETGVQSRQRRPLGAPIRSETHLPYCSRRNRSISAAISSPETSSVALVFDRAHELRDVGAIGEPSSTLSAYDVALLVESRHDRREAAELADALEQRAHRRRRRVARHVVRHLRPQPDGRDPGLARARPARRSATPSGPRSRCASRRPPGRASGSSRWRAPTPGGDATRPRACRRA